MAYDWIKDLDNLSLLATIDVLRDVNREFNLAPNETVVYIRLWKPVVPFPQLHPIDGVQIRDEYIDRRYKVTKMLATRGVIKSFQGLQGNHRWDSEIMVEAEHTNVRQALEANEAELKYRQQPPPASEPVAPPKLEPPVVPSPPEYSANNSPSHEPSSTQKPGLSMGDRIAIVGLLVAILATIGTYLAIPGVQDWVKGFISPKTKQESPSASQKIVPQAAPAVPVPIAPGPSQKPKAPPSRAFPLIAFIYRNRTLELHNLGNAEVTLWGTKLDQGPRSMDGPPVSIARDPYFYYIHTESFEQEVIGKFQDGQVQLVPFYAYLKDFDGRKFTAKCGMRTTVASKAVTVDTQTLGTKAGWVEF